MVGNEVMEGIVGRYGVPISNNCNNVYVHIDELVLLLLFLCYKIKIPLLLSRWLLRCVMKLKKSVSSANVGHNEG